MAQYLLEAKDISKIYHTGALAVGLHRVSAGFNQGEFVAITGSSGSGKSTLLNLLAGLDCYDEGELFFRGESTACYDEEQRAAFRQHNVSFVFQDYYLMDSYTVFQNIELPLLLKEPDAGKRKVRVLELADAVGLTAHLKHRTTQLSGGQKQRVAIARALATDAPILFADEPCGNLDEANTQEILGLLHRLSRDKLVFIVTHSFDEVAAYATRKLRLADGELVEDTFIKEPKVVEAEQAASVSSKKTYASALFKVASANLSSAPKRSIFGIVGLAVLICLCIVAIVYSSSIAAKPLVSPGAAYYQYDMMVSRRDGTALSKADVARLESLPYAVAVQPTDYLTGATFNLSFNFEGGFQGHLRPASQCTSEIYQGTLPSRLDQVIICIPATRESAEIGFVGKSIRVEVYANGTTYNEIYTVSGVVLSDDSVFYMYDEEYQRLHDIYAFPQYVNECSVSINTILDPSDTTPTIVVPTSAADIDLFSGSLPTTYNEVAICIPPSLASFATEFLGRYLTLSIKVIDKVSGIQFYNSRDVIIVGTALGPSDSTIESLGGPAAVQLPIYLSISDMLAIDSWLNSFSAPDGNYMVTFSPSVSPDKVQRDINDMGLLAVYMYGNKQDPGNTVRTILMLLGFAALILVAIRVLTGSFKTLEKSKRKDYNVMRTIGLPTSLSKWSYYVEMLLQALIAWGIGVGLSVVFFVAYGLLISPNAAYGLQLLKGWGGTFAWVSVVSFFIGLLATQYAAFRFNRYFYKQTVRQSIQEVEHA